MRQICIVGIVFVIQWHANFSFSSVSEFCSHDPFIVIKGFTVRFQVDNIILLKSILLSSQPRSITKVALLNKEAPRSIAEKVTSLVEV